MYSEIHEQIRSLKGKAADLDTQAAMQGRKLTATETNLKRELLDTAKELELSLPGRPVTMPGGGNLGTGQLAAVRRRPLELAGPHDRKDYQSLFGNAHTYVWEDRQDTFFNAVFSGRHSPYLIKASMTETVPSEGGFLVPSETAAQIHAVSLENEIVMPRAFVQPMMSNECHLPAMSIGNHGTNLYGGFTASYTAEAGTINEHSPSVRSMQLSAKKLTGLLRFSNELVADIPNGERQIVDICGRGLSWYRDRSFLKGTGAGEPLGILKSACLLVQAKETGQRADTIIYENLVGMLGKLWTGSFSNSVWLCHPTTIPQLLTLAVSVGTGGAPVPVLNERNGEFTILTRPVLFTEKVETLGDQGDILLADLSQYVVGLRGEMRLDYSPHVHFSTDELLARLIERHDGQPLWDSALTLEDGTTQVSPFVTLAARA